MSFANGGFEQHHRQDSDGIKPEIAIIGWRSSAGRALRAARLFQTATSFSALYPIAPKLALAPFPFGPLGCGPLARHQPLIEAHGQKSPWTPQPMTGRHAPTTASFRPLF